MTTTEPPVEPGEMEVVVGPNPASGAVQIRASLAEPARVRLSVVDVRGREVAVLHDGEASGALRATLDATGLAPGLYVVRLDVSGQVQTRTITVAR